MFFKYRPDHEIERINNELERVIEDLSNSKEPVAIGYLERFVADYERENGESGVPEVAADEDDFPLGPGDGRIKEITLEHDGMAVDQDHEDPCPALPRPLAGFVPL